MNQSANWYETTKSLIEAEAKERKLSMAEVITLQAFLSRGRKKLESQEIQLKVAV